MRRPAVLVTAALFALVALPAAGLVAEPATATTPGLICVHVIANPNCADNPPAISDAIVDASSDGVASTILVGPGSYTDGPYQLDGNAQALTLQGSGPTTILTLSANALSQTYLLANHATVSDLAITMTAASSSNDVGLGLIGATASHVTVTGPGTIDAIGVQTGTSTVTSSSIQMPFAQGDFTRGVYSSGGNTVSDSTISGSQGFELSDPSTTDTISRVSIRADTQGVYTDGGTVVIDDSVIDLGTGPSATGLEAANFNNSLAPKAISANHVTIVGGGSGSKGAWAYAAASGAKQTTTVTVANSIIRGPETSLVAQADNDGLQGGNSTATLTVTYSDYVNVINLIGPHGAGGVMPGTGNLIAVDPAFVSASDHHLMAGSPVVDKGDPVAGGPATDLDGLPRVTDGDGNGVAVRDLGAYERPTLTLPDTTAPDTSISSHPGRRITKAKAKFSFSSTEAGSTFMCKLDKKAYKPCTSPKKYKVKRGKHVFSVYAIDAAGNADPTPAVVKFKRVRKH